MGPAAGSDVTNPRADEHAMALSPRHGPVKVFQDDAAVAATSTSSLSSPKDPKERSFFLPTKSASHLRAERKAGEKLRQNVQNAGRRDSSLSPFAFLESAENTSVRSDERSSTFTSASPPSPPSSPESPESDSPEVSTPSLLPQCSPWDTANARRNRERMPQFGINLAGQGTTSYELVPEDRTIDVEDESRPARRLRERCGVLKEVEGSTNGYYQQDRVQLKLLAEEIQVSDCRRRCSQLALMAKLEEIHSERNSWASKTSSMLRDMANTSTWLDETWGPPIVDVLGTGRMLSEQYTGRKRRSCPTVQDSSPKKRMKKVDRRLSWSAQLLLGAAGTENPANGNESMQEMNSGRQHRKLVILPPAPEKPQDGICCRCRKSAHNKFMHPCLKCRRKVYCSSRCREKREQAFCSRLCRNENSTKVPLLDNQTVSSSRHQDSSKAKFAQSSPLSEGELSYLADLAKLSTANDIQAVSDKESPSPDGCQGMTNNDIEMQEALDMSAAEIAEQKQAMEGTMRRKEQRELYEKVSDLKIDGYRIIDKGRTLQYHLVDTSSRIRRRRWTSATDLQGPQWTKKMSSFWYDDEENATTRLFLEHPDGDDDFEPGPFAKVIIRAEISQERDIVFKVKTFERVVHLQGDGKYWFQSHELECRWDDAIESYWRKCEIAQQWEERRKMIEEMGLVSRQARNDSLVESREEKKSESPAYSPSSRSQRSSSSS